MPTVRALAVAALLAVLAILPSSPAPTAAATTPAAPAAGPAPSKVLYLTFDDGPSAWTPLVLDVLAEHDARATFFVVGAQAERRPGALAQVRAAGHAVGSHTYSHPHLPTAPLDVLDAELARASRAIGGPPTCLRPPGGAVDDRVRDAARRHGQAVVLWTIDPVDWRRPGANAIADHAVREARPGSVLLLHDGGGDRSQTVEALRLLLPRLVSAGYRFDTLPACR